MKIIYLKEKLLEKEKTILIEYYEKHQSFQLQITWLYMKIGTQWIVVKKINLLYKKYWIIIEILNTN